MPDNTLRRIRATVTFIVVATLVITSFLIPSVFAVAGSIARVNCYPQDQGTHVSVNYFLYQTSAVNTNTTVSVSVDGKPSIPMAYQGMKSEISSGDITESEWYTWQITVPAITAKGSHTFQFFSHYYVWQETGKYWAEFNGQTEVHTFTIGINESAPSASPDPIAPSSVLPQLSVISAGALYAIVAAAVVVIVASVTIERRNSRRKSFD